jgi:PAS domain S-box-containing protein
MSEGTALAEDSLLRQIADASPDALLLLTPEGKIAHAGASAMRLMEAGDAALLLGQDWLALWDRPERAQAQAALESVRGGRASEFTAFAYTLAKTPRWWRTRLSPLYGAPGQLTQLLVLSRDVTEQRQQEQKIGALTAQLEQRVEARTQELHRANYLMNKALEEARDLYERAPCGYWSLDLDGSFSAVNETALGWLGYQRGELIGRRRLHELLAADDQKRLDARLDWLTTGQPSPEEEYRLHRKDGSWFDASVQCAARFDFEGRFTGSRASLVDVTERRQARDALQRLNAELEGFSYTVSHDLRAPLRRVVACIAMARGQLGAGADALALDQLDHATQAAQHMRELIEALLGLAQLDRTAMHVMPLDMGRIVGEAQAAQAGECAGRAIDWQVSAALPTVVGDPLLLRQVWVNLLSNAVKYTRTRALARIEIGSAPHESGGHVFFVRDNGVGFNSKLGDKLFGVFQRLHGASEFEGVGIGLALSRKIVARHGGSIWAQGETGAGCTVWFALPPADPAAINPNP